MSLSRKAGKGNTSNTSRSSNTARSDHAPRSGKLLPPLRPWDNESFSFDLIREITSPDIRGNIMPAYEYYSSTSDTKKFSLYNVPSFFIEHLNEIAMISPSRSHSRDAMFCAGTLHGAQRFYGSPQYLLLASQYARYVDAKKDGLIEVYDAEEALSTLKSISLVKNDCGTGFKRQISYRLPEYIRVQLVPKSAGLRVPVSDLFLRFYMDAVREQPLDLYSCHPLHLEAMRYAIEEDLYPKIQRAGAKLERLLDALGAEPAREQTEPQEQRQRRDEDRHSKVRR